MTRADGFDAVVLGSGPNGLLGALTLAATGRRVLLVEAAERVGGGLRSEQLTLPGFVHDVGASVLPLALASPAFAALGLTPAEVTWAHPPVPAAHPLPREHGGDAVLVLRDAEATAMALGVDAGRWRAIVGATAAAGPPLRDALLAPLDLRAAARAAGPLVRYGVTAALPAAALARIFRTEPARAVLGGMAAHSMLSFREPSSAGYGTFLAALAHSVGWPLVRGGTERLAEALAARLLAAGGEIQTRSPVTDLRALPSAPIVLCDLTPRQFLAVAGQQLPPRYRRRLSRFRYGPGVFKIDYALDAPLSWLDPMAGSAGTVHVGGTFAEIAAAEGAVAHGRHPERPFVLVVQPTVADPSRAPSGKHVLWAYCHVPHGSTLDMTAAIEGQLERFAPGFHDRVLARHVHTPATLERWDANLVGGDIGAGRADLRQFIARPVLSTAPWRTPIPGVYLCSASTPPGAGVHGVGGWQAARLADRDAR